MFKIIEYECGFKSTDEDPCEDCPRLISAAHSCGLLLDIARDKELIEEEEEIILNE